MLADVIDVKLPDAAFYQGHVSRTGLSDTEFARRLYADYNVTVLPGSYLARDAHGTNPGRDFIRIALVAGTPNASRARNASSISAALSRGNRPSDQFHPSPAKTNMSQQLQQIIDTAWENRAELSPKPHRPTSAKPSRTRSSSSTKARCAWRRSTATGPCTSG